MTSAAGGNSRRRALRRLACLTALLAGYARAGGIPGVVVSERSGCGFRQGVFLHGPRTGNRIALTFDVCPTSLRPAFTREVADYLERARVPTTFFVSGLWAESNPESFHRLIRVSFFEIALHGHRHPRLRDASAESIRAEIEDGRAALLRLGAAPAPLFRPPYFDLSPALVATARQSGVVAITGDAGLGDPDPYRSADVLEQDAIRWVQAGSVIVLHANGRGPGTAEAVRNLVPLLRRRGYDFVRASELVAECRPPAAVAGVAD